MRRWVLALLLTEIGCTRDVVIAAPETQGARAAVVVATTGQTTYVTAVDVPSGGLPVISFPAGASDGDHALVELFLYSRSLSELHQPPGPLDGSGPRDGVSLDDPATGLQSKLGLSWTVGGDLGAWVPVSQLSARATELRLPRGPTRCVDFDRDFESTGPVLDSMCWSAFAFALDDQHALIGAGNGQIFVTSSTHARYAAWVPLVPIGNGLYEPLTAGARVTANDLWISDRSGLLFRYGLPDLTGPLQVVRPRIDSVWWLAGGGDAGRREIFALSWRGGLARVDLETQIETDIGQFPGLAGADDEHYGGVVWLGPGEAIAVSPSTTEVMHYRNGTLSWEPVPSMSGFMGIGQIDGIGTVVGNSEAAMFARQSGEWRMIAGAQGGLFPLAFASYGGGYVTGTALGALRHYVDGEECPSQFGAGFDIRHIAVVGRDIVLTGGATCASQTPLRWLRRR